MSVLSNYFGRSVNYVSSVPDDFARVVNYDENGEEFITYEKIDYKKILDSHGSVSDWSLDSLLKAGINPKFGIHTGLNTRLEGASVVEQFAAEADAIFSETPKSE